jgi:hypothetical protein
VAFTSDLGGRWGKDWVMWEHFGKFVSHMVKWTGRKESPQKFSAKIGRKAEKGTFTIDVTDDENRFVNRLDLKLKVLWPSQKSQILSLDQVAPGRYLGHFPTHERGEYYLTLFGQDREGSFQLQTYGYGIPYTAEYENMEVNHSLLKKLASISKGRVLSPKDNPQKLFKSDSPAKEYGKGLWPYLALASLILLLMDVAARKIITIRSSP